MKQQTISPKVHDKQCPNCHASGYELQTVVGDLKNGTVLVECVICEHQYTVKA